MWLHRLGCLKLLLFVSIVIVCPLGEWLELSGHFSSPGCLFTVDPGSSRKACELRRVCCSEFTQALCLEAAKSEEEELGQGFMAEMVNRVRRSQF